MKKLKNCKLGIILILIATLCVSAAIAIFGLSASKGTGANSSAEITAPEKEASSAIVEGEPSDDGTISAPENEATATAGEITASGWGMATSSGSLALSGANTVSSINLVVNAGRTMTVNMSSGASLTFSSSWQFQVYGTLTVIGTSSTITAGTTSAFHVYSGGILNIAPPANGNSSYYPYSITVNGVKSGYNDGSAIYVESGGTCNLGNATIQGGNSGGWGAVYNAGTLTMKNGSIKNNKTAGDVGGGVFVAGSGAKFEMSGGTISGNSASRCGGGVYVDTGGNFEMSGGTISGNELTSSNTMVSRDGAGVYVSGGTFTMTGGTISGNNTGNNTGYGGGVYVYSGTFNMEGGTIGGSTANKNSSQRGGGVYVGNYGTFKMSAGTISYNEATTSWGGGVCVDGTFTYASSGITISSNTAAKVGNDVCFSISKWADAISYSKSYPSTQTGVYNSGTRTASTDSTYTTAFGTDTTAFSNGRFYVPSTANIILDLNNTTINRNLTTARANGGVFYVEGKLEVTDTSTNKNGKITGGKTSGYGGGVYVSGTGTLTLSAGSIAGNTASFGGGGVGVFGGTFNMNGGTIGGSTANKNTGRDGAGVYCSSDSKFKMSNGTISHNVATGYGGGVGYNNYGSSGEFNMSGGTISDNQSATNGGGVCLQYGTATISSSSAQILNNTAVNGGGVYVSTGTFTLSRGNILSNTATGNGGGVCYAGGTFTMYGGAIGGSDAPNEALNGGGVCVSGSSLNFTPIGGTISYNTAGSKETTSSGTGGGGVCVTAGTFTLNTTNVSITNNTTTEYAYGGGVSVIPSSTTKDSAKFVMSNGYIRSNSAKYGGGVAVLGSGGFTLSNGTIGGYTGSGTTVTKYTNHASTHGGGVFLQSSGTLAMSGGNIYSNRAANGGGVAIWSGEFKKTGGSIGIDNNANSGNEATTYGGGVYINAGGKFTMSAGDVDRNKAPRGGGVYVGGSDTEEATFELSGGYIEANTATSYGGGVYVTNGTFKMTGGNIGYMSGTTTYGNTAASHGGGVHINSGGTFTMSGGDIKFNTATNTTADGGGVYIGVSASEFTMTGGNIYSNTAGRNGGGIRIAGGEISISGTSSRHSRIYSNTANTNDGYGGGISVNAATSFSIGAYTDIYSNQGIQGGGIFSNASFEIKNSTTKIYSNTASNGGAVYMNGRATLTMSAGTIGGSESEKNTATYGGGVYIKNSTFNFTGGTISYNEAATAWGGGVFVTDSGTLNMSDSAVIAYNMAGAGGGVGVSSSGTTTATAATFNLSGGNIYSNRATATSLGGGGVNVSANSTFKMEGGNIYSNTAAQYGGGVMVNTGATFNMEGGTIGGSSVTYKNSAQYGGGVFGASSSVIEMTGGTISYNTVTASGAGIGVQSGTVKVSGGTITKNEATSSGGGISINGTLEISGEALITENKASSGGGLYIGTGTFKLSGGTISNNTAASGGGVYLGTGTLTMSGEFTISNNQATTATATANTYGGGVYMTGGTFNMEGGYIEGNLSTNTGSDSVSTYGGGVHVANGTFNLSGGYIRGNVARSNGGGVFVGGTATFKMTGGTIGGDTSELANKAYNGAGLFIQSTTKATFSAGTIINNDATYGGGIYLNGTAVLDMSGTAEVTGNKAIIGAGVFIGANCTLNMESGEISGNILKDGSDPYASAVRVYAGSTFNMSGGYIRNNTKEGVNGGATVITGGTFKMTGGEISGNSGRYYAGVEVLAGTTSISNARITDNTSESAYGNGVYVHTGAKLELGGEVYIYGNTYHGTENNLYVRDEQSVSFTSKLTGDSKIGIVASTDMVAADEFVITSGFTTALHTAADVSKYFVSDVRGLVLEYKNSEVVVSYDIVLAWNETVKASQDNNSTETFILFKNWTAENSSFGTGVGFTDDGTILVPEDASIIFDFYGLTVDRAGTSGSVMRVEGTLVFEGNRTGMLKGGNTENGGGVYVAGGSFTLVSGCNICDNTASYGGGVYIDGDGTFIMQGNGLFRNTAENGGAVYVKNGTFVFEGGVIGGTQGNANSATSHGGGVYVEGGGNFEMSGGTISYNTALNGAGVYVKGGRLAIADGNVNNNAAENNGGGIYVESGSAELGGNVNENTAENGAGVYNANASVTVVNGYISSNTASENGGGVYAAGGAFNVTGGEIGANIAGDNGAGIYVSGVSTQVTVSDGNVGRTAPSSTTEIVYIAGGTFNLTNNGSIDVMSSDSAKGGNAVLLSSGTFNMSGGEITGVQFRYGGGVYMTGGEFNMTGGEIHHNTSTYGAGVYVDGGTFTLAGGTITNNTVLDDEDATLGGFGGGVYNNGTFTFTSGTISNNIATNGKGGGVYNNGTFTLGNGSITGNTAANGSGVYNAKTFNMNGGEISGNTATNGSVYLDGGTFNFTGGDIKNNTATAGGGGVRMDGGSTFNMSGTAKISGNTAQTGAGVVVGGGAGTFTMNGGTISENEASVSGGGVYVFNTAFVMNNGSITGNSATNGGGVYVENVSNATFTMNDGEISENTSQSGAGVYVKGTFNLAEGSITGNTATYGAGVYNAGTLNMTGGEISGNTASVQGAGVYVADATVTMSGGSVTENRATAATEGAGGGGFYITNSEVTVSGTAKISDNYSARYGGGMRIMGTNTTNVVISGGSLVNNTATVGGGAYLEGNFASLTVTESATVAENTATTNGGGVAVYGGATAEVAGNAFLTKNIANANGGGVYVTGAGSKLTLSDNGAITYNSANYGGAVYVTAGGTFTMHSGSLAANSADTNGGAVYVNGGTFNFEDGEIFGNSAEGNGGAIFVATGSTSVVEISGGVIGGEDENSANTAVLGGGMYIAGGNVTMTSGTITGNKATTNGGGVYFNAGKLSVAGDLVISDNFLQDTQSNLYLYNGKTITVIGELTEGAKIGLTGKDKVTEGYNSNGNDEAQKDYFFGDLMGTVVAYVNYEIYLQISLKDAWNAAVQASFDDNGNPVTFVLSDYWNAENGVFGEGIGFTDSGALYLPAKTHIILNLNNYTIDRRLTTATAEGSVFYVKGTLEIAGTTGQITGGFAQNGGGVYVQEGGSFKLSVGYVQQNKAVKNGGGVYVEKKAAFELSGGAVRGNTAENGAGVYIEKDGEFAMIGGAIGGTGYANTATSGGGVYSEGSFKMVDGNIRNNTATNGGGVYVNDGKFIAEGGYIGGTAIAAANTATDGSGVYVAGGEFVLDGATVAYNTATHWGTVYVIGGIATIESGKISNNTANEGAGGASVTASGKLVINGGEISNNNAPNYAGVLVDGIVTMNGGKISDNTINSSTVESNGGGLYIAANNDAVFTMNGGEISGNTAYSGAGVFGKGGKFVMNDGLITGNTATHNGAGVYLANLLSGETHNACVFEMNGGEISGNTATDYGGGLATYGGSFKMTGGEISGNTASLGGGLIINVADAEITMVGGKISGNTARDGGGVYLNGGTFTMNGGEISGNNATDAVYGGGGVYVRDANGTFNMTGGEIFNNTTAGYGGGVYNYGTVNISGGRISDNTANVSGGGISSGGGTITMTGGEISGNTATTRGGGVLVAKGGGVLSEIDSKFVMSNGTISGNTAGYGGGIVIYSGATATLTGGKITANSATVNGGGIYVAENSNLEVSGSPIVSGNTENGAENNVYLTANQVITVTGMLSTNGTVAWIGVTMANPTDRTFTSGFAANNTAYNPALRPETVFFSDDTDYMVSLEDGEAILKDNDYSQTSLVWQFSKDGGTTWINVETPNYSLRYKYGEEYMVRAKDVNGNTVNFDWAQDSEGNTITSTSTFAGIGSYKFVVNSEKYTNPSFSFEILPATLIWQYRTDQGNDEEGWLDLTVDSLVYTGATYRIRAAYFNNGVERVQEFEKKMKDVGNYVYTVDDDELYENPTLKFTITTRYIDVAWDFGDAQGNATDGYYWNYDGLVHTPVAVLNGVSDLLVGIDLDYEYARLGDKNYGSAQKYAGVYTLTVGFEVPDKNVVLSNTSVQYRINGIELSLVWTDEEGNEGEEFTFEFNNLPQGVGYILSGVITGDEVKAYVTYSTRTGKVLSGAPTAVGYYTATIRLDDDCYNYVLDKAYTCQIVITQKSISVEWTDGTEWTFNGLGQGPTATVTNPYTGLALSESYKTEYAPVASNGNVGTFTTNKPVNAGNYVVRITLNNSDSNFVLDDTSMQYFSIKKLDVEITWTGADGYDADKDVYFWEYDGEEHVIGSEISLIGFGVHKDGGILDYLAIERSDSTVLTDVGSATATVVLANNDFNANFNITNSTSQVYEVRKAVITGVTWTDKFMSNYASGDEPQYNFGTISGENGPAFQAVGITLKGKEVILAVTYSKTYAEDWVVDETVGYIAYARLSATDAANFELAEGAEYESITFFIMSVGGFKQEISVTWVVFINDHDYVSLDDYKFVYNGEVQYPTPIYVKDIGYEVLDIQPNSVGADAGEYTARVKPSSVYNIIEGFTCTYVIEQLDIEVKWQYGQYDSNGAPFKYVYNGNEQKPYAYVDANYDFDIDITVTGKVIAGTHTATAVVNGNFNITEGETTEFTIEKLGLSTGLIVWDYVEAGASGDATNGWYWIYDGLDHAPKATIPARNWGGDYDIELVVTGATSEIGNHIAYAVLSSSIPEHNNFKLLDTVSTEFEIVQVKAGQVYWTDGTHTYVDGASGDTGLVFTYNGNAEGQPIRAYFLDGENNRVYLNVAIIGVPVAIEVGTYTAYVTDDLSFNSEVPMCTFRIVPMQVTVAWGETTELTFNGKVQHPKLTVTAGGKELDEGTDYEVTGFMNAGSYTAEIKFINTNYTCAETDATCEFVIGKITLTSSDFAWSAEDSYQYNGEDHAPELTVTYSIDGVDVVFEIGYYGKTSELGKHTVTAYIVSATLDGVEVKDNFILNAEKEYTIKAVSVTVVWDFGEIEANADGVYEWTYDETSHEPVVYIEDEDGNRIKNAKGEDITLDIYGGAEINARSEAYTVTAVLPDGYSLASGSQLTQKYLINKAKIEVNWVFEDEDENVLEAKDGVYSWTYGDKIVIKAYVKEADGSNGRLLCEIKPETDAGTHTATVSQSNGNYEFGSEADAQQTYTIKAMTVYVAWYGVGGLEENDKTDFVWTYVDNETPIAPTAYLADADGNLLTDANGDYIKVHVSGAGTEIGGHVAQAEDTFGNYEFAADARLTQNFTIEAKDLDIKWNNSDDTTFTYEYSGNNIMPVPVTDVDGIEFNLEIVKVNEDDGSEDPVLAITEVGTYKVTATSSDGNYKVLAGKATVTVIVTAKTVEVEWDKDTLVLVYNGKAQQPKAYYFDVDNNIIALEVEVVEDNGGITVGGYTAKAKLESDNYVLSGDTTTFEIVPKEVKVEWTWEDVDYDTNPHAPESAIAADGENGIFVTDINKVTVAYKITDKDGNVVAGTYETDKKVTEAGEYKITLWLEGDAKDNYTLDVAEHTFNINKIKLTVTVKDKELTYGNSLTLTIDDCTIKTLVAAEAEDIMKALKESIANWLTCAYTNNSAPGEYTIYIDAGWLRKNILANYDVTAVNGKLTVNPAEGKLVWQADRIDEDGNPVFTYDGEDNLPKAYYYDAKGTRHNLSVSLADNSFAVIEGSAVNVGTYYAVIVDENGNAITGHGSYTFENYGTVFNIEKREITVTVKDLTFTYGEVTEENLEELLGLDIGWLYGEVKPVDDIGITVTVDGTCVNGFLNANGDKAATYAIVTSWNDADFGGNYTVNFEGATELTVKPATITVKDYDGIYAKDNEVYTVYDDNGIREANGGYLSPFIEQTEKYLELAGYDGATITAYFTMVDDRNIAPENDRYGADAEALTEDGAYNFMIKVDNHTTLYGRLYVKVGYADSYIYMTVSGKTLEEAYGYETFASLANWLIENGYADFDEDLNLRNSGTSKADFLEWVTATVYDENGNEVSGKLAVGTYKVIFGLNEKATEGLSIYKASARFVTIVITPYVLSIDWGNAEDNLNYTYDGEKHFPSVTVEGVTLKEGKNVITVNGEEVTVTVTVDGDFTAAGGHSVLVTVESDNFKVEEDNALRSVSIIEPAAPPVEVPVPGDNTGNGDGNVTVGLTDWQLGLIIAAAILLAAIIIALVIILVKRRKPDGDDDGFYDPVDESDL